jgi:hypothetical protein
MVDLPGIGGGNIGDSSDAPEPGQNVCGKNGDPCTGSYASKRLFGAWFSVGELIAADHDRNETGDLCDRSGKQSLHGGEAGIEWRTALRVSKRGEHG